MDYVRITTISEQDFDSIVTDAGGSRIDKEGSADYLLNETVIELKLIEEEGLDKQTRQAKLAKIFLPLQPSSPVVVIDPATLDAASAREYYKAVAGPIQSAVKKAAGQLETTLPCFPQASVRVLVILNNGYSALSEEEFKSVCLKCVRNDTHKIDCVVIGGIYYHSDKFDNYLIAPFEHEAINLSSSFSSYDLLADAWGRFIDRKMTALIRSEAPPASGKLPVIDLSFEMDGVRYVKVAPPLGKSGFWPGSRPRKNTTSLNACPPVAWTLPRLNRIEWFKFKQAFPEETTLHTSYEEWCGWLDKQEHKAVEKLKPLVCIDVSFTDFADWVNKPQPHWRFSDVQRFVSETFEKRIRKIFESIRDREKMAVLLPEYIHLVVREIGQDKANDLCSVYHVWETANGERREPIIENQNIFFKYGAAVAAAYAIRLNVNEVLFSTDRTYGWV